MSTRHETFTLTRDLAARPAQVLACWADAETKRAWFVDSDGPGWETQVHALDFRVGGSETGRFELKTGPGAGVHENATTFLAIVPDRRIDFAYTMAMNGRVHSASLATVTFEATGGGTRLTYTETLAEIGESDGVTGRSAGWEGLLGHLETCLTRESADG
jgi:uncharacterized protein YndB with AHSA1/START domain